MKLKFLLLLLILVACKQPSNIIINPDNNKINRSKMILLQTDMQLFEALLSNIHEFNDFVLKEFLYQSILEKHNVSKIDYDSTLMFYKQNLNLYKLILDSVQLILKNKTELDLPYIPRYDSTMIRKKDSLFRINRNFPERQR